MAYDEGLAERMRAALAEEAGITETQIFGGLCFFKHGNMICGVHAGGAMFRPGKVLEAQARALPGTGPMLFTGTPMGGMVDAGPEALKDDETFRRLTALSLAHARGLPPK